MSLSGELSSVLPVQEQSTERHDHLHPNQDIQLEQINEDEMIEEKLVIPDDMEQYLSQAAQILDMDAQPPTPAVAPPVPSTPAPVQQQPVCYPANYQYPCQQVPPQGPSSNPQMRNGFHVNNFRYILNSNSTIQKLTQKIRCQPNRSYQQPMQQNMGQQQQHHHHHHHHHHSHHAIPQPQMFQQQPMPAQQHPMQASYQQQPLQQSCQQPPLQQSCQQPPCQQQQHACYPECAGANYQHNACSNCLCGANKPLPSKPHPCYHEPDVPEIQCTDISQSEVVQAFILFKYLYQF